MELSRRLSSHQVIESSKGMVTTQHPLAVKAGVEALQRGGNAVDAAVTAAFAIGVLQPLWNGIGGGGLIVVQMANETPKAIDYGMQLPGLATPGIYQLENDTGAQGFSRSYSVPAVKDGANDRGYQSVSIPGTLAGLSKALELWGTFSLSQALGPAIDYAESGFQVEGNFILATTERSEVLLEFPETAAIYFPGGRPLKIGQRLVQPEHAETLKKIAAQGADEFYRGEIGALISKDMEANGGLLRMSDFEQYEPIIHEEAETVNYRGHQVSTMPGPCGGPTVLEILKILENFDLPATERGSADWLHLQVEATRLAAIDRFSFMGASKITGFPISSLVEAAYAKTRAVQIDMASRGAFEAGDPWTTAGLDRPEEFPIPAGQMRDRGTIHVSVVDSQHNAVALTQTNMGYSGVVNPGVGVMLNNAMGWACPVPGTVNSIVPHGRALNNMCPTIVSRNGRVEYVVGGSGGRRIWPAIAQIVSNLIDYGMTLQEAIEAPRMHVESDDPMIDDRFSTEAVRELESRGHRVSHPPENYLLWPFTEANGIEINDRTFRSGVAPGNKPAFAGGV